MAFVSSSMENNFSDPISLISPATVPSRFSFGVGAGPEVIFGDVVSFISVFAKTVDVGVGDAEENGVSEEAEFGVKTGVGVKTATCFGAGVGVAAIFVGVGTEVGIGVLFFSGVGVGVCSTF